MVVLITGRCILQTCRKKIAFVSDIYIFSVLPVCGASSICIGLYFPAHAELTLFMWDTALPVSLKITKSSMFWKHLPRRVHTSQAPTFISKENNCSGSTSEWFFRRVSWQIFCHIIYITLQFTQFFGRAYLCKIVWLCVWTQCYIIAWWNQIMYGSFIFVSMTKVWYLSSKLEFLKNFDVTAIGES